MAERSIDRIVSNPEICRGRATVAGTRIPVSVVLDNLADGETVEAVCRAYPPLTPEDVRACLAYAAMLANDRLDALPDAAA